MPQEGGWWAAVLTRITTVRQGLGVIGQLSAVKLAVLAVVAIAVYCIVPDLYVTIPLLLIVVGLLAWERDSNVRALKFAHDHPEYASLGPQQTVQVIKAQASLRQAQLPPSPNTAPPLIDVPPMIQLPSDETKSPVKANEKPAGEQP